MICLKNFGCICVYVPVYMHVCACFYVQVHIQVHLDGGQCSALCYMFNLYQYIFIAQSDGLN